MRKFGRNYVIKFRIGRKPPQAANENFEIEWVEEVVVKYPLTLQFSVIRADWCEINGCTLQILNLNEDTRAKLYKDIYGTDKFIDVEFYAGYGEDETMLPLLYKGDVRECFSFKQGVGTDFITTVQCLTGAINMYMTYSNRVMAEGTKALDVIKQLCSDIGLPLEYYSKTIVDRIPPLSKDTSFIGKSFDKLVEFVTYQDNMLPNVKIDNGGIYILGKDDVLPIDVIKITPESGLLGYPKRREILVEAELLFEPRIQQCSLALLESGLDDFFNGGYKVVGFTHTGTISGAIGGDCRTKVALQRFVTGTYEKAVEVKNG